MSYNFTINVPWYKVKEDKRYMVKCASPWEIKVFRDDVLTRNKDNSYFTIHTGICVTAIDIPEEDLIEQTKEANLRLL